MISLVDIVINSRLTEINSRGSAGEVAVIHRHHAINVVIVVQVLHGNRLTPSGVFCIVDINLARRSARDLIHRNGQTGFVDLRGEGRRIGRDDCRTHADHLCQHQNQHNQRGSDFYGSFHCNSSLPLLVTSFYPIPWGNTRQFSKITEHQ